MFSKVLIFFLGGLFVLPLQSAEAVQLLSHQFLNEDDASTPRWVEVDADPREKRQQLPNFLKKPLQMRFQIQNASDLNSDWVLRLSGMSYEKLEYSISNEGTQVASGIVGGSIPLEARPLATHETAFPIVIPPGESRQIHVTLTTRMPLQYWPEVLSRKDFEKSTVRAQGIFTGYFGFMFALTLAVFFIYFSNRDPVVLQYLFFEGAVAFHFFARSGLADEFLPHYSAGWGSLFPFTANLATFFSLTFCRRFLETSGRAPKLDRVLLFFMMICPAVAIFYWMSPGPVSGAVNEIVFFLNTLVVIVSSVSVYKTGYGLALLFLGSMGFQIAGALTFVFANRGWIQPWVPAPYLAIVGSTLEIVFLTFGIAYRTLQLRKKYIESLKRDSEMLQIRVKERTHELESANQALKREIEERKTVEIQLEHQRASSIYASRMSALGEMAGGIAHEINNPLSVIRSFASLIERKLQLGEVDQEDISANLKRIDSSVVRISKIIGGLRAFSRDAAYDPLATTSVQKLIDETTELCRNELKLHDIQFEVKVSSQDLTVDCREAQICQILVNLITNARDAISVMPEKWIRLQVDDRGDSVQITVTDSGSGIPLTVREKIMQPFFTTKEIGRGLGLGLSISKGLAESHSGSLHYDPSAPNTSFVLTLPK